MADGHVSIDTMAELDITVTIQRRVLFRLWLFTVLMRAAQWVYPGHCNLTIEQAEDAT